MAALFADQLRDQRREIADARERISALEAAPPKHPPRRMHVNP